MYLASRRRFGEGPHGRQWDRRIHPAARRHRTERDSRGVDRHVVRGNRPQFGLWADVRMRHEGTDTHGRLPAVALPATPRSSGASLWPLRRLYADEKSYLEPLPVAVHVIEVELAQPHQLRLDVEQA